jgi:hypothetical protein
MYETLKMVGVLWRTEIDEKALLIATGDGDHPVRILRR